MVNRQADVTGELMINETHLTTTRRKFRRSDLPLEVKFKPTYGAKDYYSGVISDLSCEGLGLTADDFKFIKYEYLELIIDLPGAERPVSLFGDILWKKQNGRRCAAGIKFRMKDKGMQEDAIHNICLYTDIPVHDMYSRDSDYVMPPENKKTSDNNLALSNKLGFIKQYNKNRTKCKVTFRLLREDAKNSQSVTIVGDFNNWEAFESPMSRLKNGDFAITLELNAPREYRFKYLIDGLRWENDPYADRFVRNNYGSKDSVVIV
jgi:hypothetical protein